MTKSHDREASKKKSKLDKRFEEIIQNETRYGIIMAIKTYGSSNIKTLAQIMGKTESTIFHHITDMLKEPKVIEIDLKKTESTRGKYYKLTKGIEERYSKEDTAYEKEIPDLLNNLLSLPPEKLPEFIITTMKNNPDLGTLAKSARRSLAYYHNIENFILNNFERAENALKEGLIPAREDFPIGSFSNLSIDLKISSPHHVLLIVEAITEFFHKLFQLKKQFKAEIDETNVKEEDIITEHIHLFGGELGEFPFIEGPEKEGD